ncbi:MULTISPECIES: hypothetical protein [unclassified Streptomyces]|uniref:hypothetical protein n=1 Tax=unclassified Streptomyces TaxID=2593676 RepID=UPI00332496AA
MTPKFYCRGYRVAELRRFEGWASLALAPQDHLGDGDVAYVWDDFTVVDNPVVAGAATLVAAPTDDWRAFCRAELGFEIPEGLLEDALGAS